MLENRGAYHPKSEELKKGYKVYLTFESGYETAYESEYKKNVTKWCSGINWLEKNNGKLVKKEIVKVG